jgi:hypothetical protein
MAPAQDSNQEREPKAFLRDGMDGWREILDDARWAPSPHNTQPWLVRPVSPEAAELYAPRERLLPVEDPEGRFQTAAQGIFLEALDVAAGTLGLTVETEPLFPSLGADADERPLVARLRLGPREEPARFAAQLLHRRRTSRLPYDGRPVDEQALAELSAIAAELGHQARFTSDPALVDWVVPLNADTVFYDLDEDHRREEIARWTHLSNRTAQARGDGFSPARSRLPGAARPPLLPSPWCLSSRSRPRTRAEALSAQHARHGDRRLDRGILEHTGGVPRSRADAAPFLARAHRARALSPALRLRHHQPHLPRSPSRATPGQRSRA